MKLTILDYEIPLQKDYYETFKRTKVPFTKANREMRVWFDDLNNEDKYDAFYNLLLAFEGLQNGEIKYE